MKNSSWEEQMAFEYLNKQLHLIQNNKTFNLLKLAREVQQPFYVYDLNGLLNRLQFFKKHIAPARVYYAVKANSHSTLLKAFAGEHVGVDVVSGGELNLALKAGFPGRDIVFSGVGKTEMEIQQALQADILQFNVESVSELKKIAALAGSLNKKTRVAFRMNPDVDLDTHPYIKTGLREHKFGLDETQLPELKNIVRKHSSQLELYGLTLHIGSQIHNLKPLKKGIGKIQSLFTNMQNEFPLQTLDVGGGLGIDYKKINWETDLQLIREYGLFLKELSKTFSGQILTEPGRILTGRFACLIGEIQYIKTTPYKNFVILNTGMHHLIRPCLYQAYHQIVPLEQRTGAEHVYDVVGPICESADILGLDRKFKGLQEKDFLAVLDTGAYGSVMASSYNTQALPKEIFISQGEILQ